MFEIKNAGGVRPPTFLPLTLKIIPITLKMLQTENSHDIMKLKGENRMKIKIFIDKEHDEEIQIFAHEKNELVKKIERLVNGEEGIIAKHDRTLYNLELCDIVCFTADDNKVYAHLDRDVFEVDEKIYELEETLPDNFLKINKSCIANIEKIKSFDASVTGTLCVNFKNGYRDYVSRRRMKYVKERLIKK